MRPLSRRTIFALPLALPAIAAAKPSQGFATGGVIKRAAVPFFGEAGPEAIIPLRTIKTLSIAIDTSQYREALVRIAAAAIDARADDVALSHYVGG